MKKQNKNIKEPKNRKGNWRYGTDNSFYSCGYWLHKSYVELQKYLKDINYI